MRASRVTRALGPVLALGALVVLVGCGDDGPSVATRLGDDLQEQLGIEDAEVSCPERAEAERGARFDCRVSKGGETATIRVTFDTDDHFTFDLAEGEPVPEFLLEAVDAQLPATTTSSMPSTSAEAPPNP